ncbi:YHS domain-containing protein [Hoyosella sp. YIM 151337]|uniref:YHS domain-containing protein n=1 Tax=Hoyosella sp. YIM 151337 TaxID=2992742 RepID=UPI0022369B14|nr:adenylate/guanylate cyclase domain-containing protein [Hoyosella sp. YIM 151337]MCW4351966.1 YHS domain-containing protein [Hoyosella sp. YIM 151337]
MATGCDGAEPLFRAEGTFIFADLAGFTALTEAHGDESAADLAHEFVCAAAPVLSECGAEQVKTLGDALMLRVPEPAAAIRLGLLLANDLLSGYGYPDVRVGMHHGTAVSRDGDWFGSTVNIASRIGALAGRRQVLASQAVADAAGDIPGVSLTPLGPRSLRNIPVPVELFEAEWADRPARESVLDPVCQMTLDTDHAPHRLRHDGTMYYFCSAACAGKFAASPESYPQGR